MAAQSDDNDDTEWQSMLREADDLQREREERECDVDAVVQGRMPSSRLLGLRYAVGRFVIRTLRIAGGLAVGLLALWTISYALETLGQPFASLSPLGVIGGLFAGLVGLLLVVAAFSTAFGEGESREEYEARLKGEIRVEVERAMPKRA